MHLEEIKTNNLLEGVLKQILIYIQNLPNKIKQHIYN